MDGIYTVWNVGPNFSEDRGGGVGIYDLLFNNTYLGYNQVVIQHDNAIVDINATLNVDQSVNVTNTLSANIVSVNNIVATVATINTTLTVQQVICSPATQGAALHIYGDPDYSAELAFMNSTGKLFEVGTTTTNVATGTGNFFFIYNNQNATYSIQIITGTTEQINLNENVEVH